MSAAAPPPRPADPTASYVPRRLHETVKSRIVPFHLESFLAETKRTGPALLVNYGVSTFVGYFACGDIARGPFCFHCDGRDHDILVALPCAEGGSDALVVARLCDPEVIQRAKSKPCSTVLFAVANAGLAARSSAFLCGPSKGVGSPPMVPVRSVGYAPRMQHAPTSWVIDPDDPRAPPQELWDRMTSIERQRVVALLPSEFEVSQASPPEGDFHFQAKTVAKDTLSGYFQRLGRRVYLACELPVYYPNEPLFAPDLIAVLDVEQNPRMAWTVSNEGKGIDLALEVLWAGSAKKDLVENVERYAALGIPEYFVFDRQRLRLRGYRLPSPTATRYQPLIPQEGRLACAVLGLELGIEGEKLRFFHGLAPLPETGELIARLGSMVGDLEKRMDDTERRAEEAERALAEERSKLTEALAEIDRLKRERH